MRKRKRRHWALEALNSTWLRFPHWEIPSKAELTEVVATRRGVDQATADGADLKAVEKCSIESSAYECIWLCAEESKPLTKTAQETGQIPERTPQLIEKEGV